MRPVKGEAVGTMDRRVRIDEAVEAQNDLGEAVITWQELTTVFAAIDYRSGLESEDSEQATAFTTVYYRIRHRTDITPKMRIVDGSIIYDIVAVLDYPGRRTYQELRCVQFEV